MVVQEVRNETFHTEEREKKRKRVKAKRTRQEDRVLVEPALAPKNVRISEYISNSTNVNHKIYRDILINRKNGERVTVLNQLK
ncbi:hypothetical protein NEAUS03_1463 [Nematocida ausubeli]|nr:hypothetical protein NEAUS03_1463 [Nematocida ausubeli]